MNERYRNRVCPWQTAKEIRNACKTIDGMLAGVPRDQHDQLLGLDKPDKIWVAKGGVVWSHDRWDFVAG